MSYYVSIPRLSGRGELVKLMLLLDNRGYSVAEYADGGWYDYSCKIVHPHIKFDAESDAIAYALSIGTTYSTTMPIIDPESLA